MADDCHSPVALCPVCGPGATLHTICHPTPGYRRYGCGHSLDDHTDGLRCRVCKRECGNDPGWHGSAVPMAEREGSHDDDSDDVQTRRERVHQPPLPL